MNEQMQKQLALKARNLGQPISFNSTNELKALSDMVADNRMFRRDDGLYVLTPAGGLWLDGLET